MFGLFAPKCPLDLNLKVWTEFRMLWLAGQFGIERLMKAPIVLTSAELISESYQGNDADGQKLLYRLAAEMGAAPPGLKIIDDSEIKGEPEEKKQEDLIVIPRSGLNDPQALVITLLRGLAQHVLRSRASVDGESADQEQLTDLFLIYHGFGVVIVNALTYETPPFAGGRNRWLARKGGRLAPMDFGYAMALVFFVRGEAEPACRLHLQADAAEVMKKGLNFLHKTGDTVFHPDKIREKLGQPSVAQAHDYLKSGTASEQLMTLWQLDDNPMRDDAVVELITTGVADRQAPIASAACDALKTLGQSAVRALPALLKALGSNHPRVRAAAASALGTIHKGEEKVIPALIRLLDETNPLVLAAAGQALVEFGGQARDCVPALLQAIDAALYRHPNEPSVPFLVLSVARLDREAELHVRDFYEAGNDEHRDHVLEMLRDLRPTDASMEREEELLQENDE